MLIVKIKSGEKIESAINRYKKKFRDARVLKDIKSRVEYVKPSIKRRAEKNKAKYIQSKK